MPLVEQVVGKRTLQPIATGWWTPPCTAASAAAARTSASAWASASAILLSADLGAAGDEIFHLGLGFGRDAFGLRLGRW